MASTGKPILLESLPQKDKTAFKAVHKLYDDHQYAKAAKGIDSLVKKNSECIEILSLKALILRNIPNRKEEGLNSVKQALRLNIRSSTAWHVLGSFNKMEGHFDEALKGYKQAVRCDPTDLHLLRDLSFMQLYLQQWDDFLESRKLIFRLSNDTKSNWYSIPLALHFGSRQKEAAEMLLKWWSFPPEVLGEVTDLLDSELRLYLVRLFEESSQYERALAHCSSALTTGLLKTELAMLTKKGRLELRLGKFEAAGPTYWRLLELLPENMDYVFGHFLSQRHLSERILTSPFDETVSLPVRLYPDALTGQGVVNADWVTEPLLQSLHPFQMKLVSLDRWGRRQSKEGRFLAPVVGDFWRCLLALENFSITHEEENSILEYCQSSMQQLNLSTCDSFEFFPLAFIRSESNYKKILSQNLQKKINRVSAAIFKYVDCFFELGSDPRVAWTLDVLHDLREKSEKAGHPLMAAICEGVELQWQIHYTNDYQDGLDRLVALRQRFPTFLELGLLQAEALSLKGDIDTAADLYCSLVRQDEADRYLNDACVCALVQAGRLQEGLQMSKIFRKQSEGTDRKIDMQNMAFEIALAEGYERLGIWSCAASRYHSMLKRFQMMREESVDFYLYCLRRGTLSIFYDYIALVNRMKQHKFFVLAAEKLVDLYFDQADNLLQPERIPKHELPCLEDEPPIDSAYEFTKSPSDCLHEIAIILQKSGPITSIGLLQRQYLLYSRQEIFDLSLMIEALKKLCVLLAGQVSHPEVAPYLIHFICTHTSVDEPAIESFLADIGLNLDDYEKQLFVENSIRQSLASELVEDKCSGIFTLFLLETSEGFKRGCVLQRCTLREPEIGSFSRQAENFLRSMHDKAGNNCASCTSAHKRMQGWLSRWRQLISMSD